MRKFKINRGRNVTLKMGTGHPGYIFRLDEIGGDNPDATADAWVKDGVIEDITPDAPKAVETPKAEEPKKVEGLPKSMQAPKIVETPKAEEPKKKKPGRPPGGGAKRK